MGKIRCSYCNKNLGVLDSRARGQAVIECYKCKTINKYSNPSFPNKNRKSINISIKIKDGDDSIPF